MKKFLLTLTTMSLCLALVSCSSDEGQNTTVQSSTPQAETSTPTQAAVPAEAAMGQAPEGQVSEGMQGGMGAMSQLPEGVELPEGFETMTMEEQASVMEGLGIELPQMGEGMQGAMGEGMQGAMGEGMQGAMGEGMQGAMGEGMQGAMGEGMQGAMGEGMQGAMGMMPQLPEGVELPEGFELMTEEEQIEVLTALGVQMPEMPEGIPDAMANQQQGGR